MVPTHVQYICLIFGTCAFHVIVIVMRRFHLNDSGAVSSAAVVKDTDHSGPNEVQSEEGKAPVGEVDKPFLVAIGRMKATVYNPTEAVSGKDKTIYGDCYVWDKLFKKSNNTKSAI